VVRGEREYTPHTVPYDYDYDYDYYYYYHYYDSGSQHQAGDCDLV